jgi:tyrosyl-tRNA synthetase
MNKFPSLNEQMDVIQRGVEEIIPENELVKKIETSIKKKIPLKVKFGCDPSRPDLHIGHAVLLRKLRQFQDLGHLGILLIGDFTAMIGDPTGRNKTRPQITIEDTNKNAESYIDQATIILDKLTLEIVYNSHWLGKMNFNDVIRLSSKYTVARMLERDDFTKRYEGGIPISVHEFLYPLAQGYDSVFLKADVELGGTDQKFNLLVGRDLQKEAGQPPQAIITTPLLEGTDGIEKMSKSYDNYIGLTDTPEDMFGKTLSIPDSMISKYFEFATVISNTKLAKINQDLKSGSSNPRDLKRQLAREIVSMYYSNSMAQEAQDNFDKLFIKKDIPDEMDEYKITSNEKLISIMVKNKMVGSNGDAKRMIKQGGVKIDDNKVTDLHLEIIPEKERVLKVGKRKFLRITI